MMVYSSIHQLIGNTPMVKLNSFARKGISLFAKLEGYNPGGSMKDRLGMYLVEDAIKRGKLQEGGTIIEPTAGNTGIGIALAAIGRNLRVIFVVPEQFSKEKQELMKALGAEIIHTPSHLGMVGAIEKAKQLVKEIPGAYAPLQFENPANPEAYYYSLGPELWQQMDGQIDIFVAGAGTGGTFMGCARYLKEKNPGIKTVIVEPQGSILNGGEKGPHRTEGIGMEFLPPYMDPAYFDAIHTIMDDDAFHMVKELARKEGIFAGSSSGAVLAAALKEQEEAPPGSRIVMVFPDSSERYLSKNIYGGE
jgi:O-acetylserine dependent cystathionine beta-synthase